MDVLGQNLTGLRSSSAAFGVASLVGQAVLAWNLFDPTVALVSLIPLAAYHWHVHLSRTGENYIHATALAVWCFALLAWARRRKSPRLFFASGVMAGLGSLTYPGARIAVPILAVFWASEFVFNFARRRE